jgi:hypothetical protein
VRKSLCGVLLLLAACDNVSPPTEIPKKKPAAVTPVVKDRLAGFDRDAAVDNITYAIKQNARDPDGVTVDAELRDRFFPTTDKDDKPVYQAFSYVRVENKFGGHDKVSFVVRAKPNGDIVSLDVLGGGGD